MASCTGGPARPAATQAVAHRSERQPALQRRREGSGRSGRDDADYRVHLTRGQLIGQRRQPQRCARRGGDQRCTQQDDAGINNEFEPVCAQAESCAGAVCRKRRRSTSTRTTRPSSSRRCTRWRFRGRRLYVLLNIQRLINDLSAPSPPSPTRRPRTWRRGSTGHRPAQGPRPGAPASRRSDSTTGRRSQRTVRSICQALPGAPG